MRHFVVFDSGVISTVRSIYIDRDEGVTYFSVDDIKYKYDPNRYYADLPTGNKLPCFVSPFYKQDPGSDEWYATNYIKCLLEIREEDGVDMNYFQSTDFNAGVIYNKIERNLVHNMLNSELHSYTFSIDIPTIQIVPKGCDLYINKNEAIEATLKAAGEHFDAVYGNNYSLTFKSAHENRAYTCIPCIIIRKEKYKEMTVAEIEKVLGYKIKVVGDK